VELGREVEADGVPDLSSIPATVRWLTSGLLPPLTQPLDRVPMLERVGFVPRDLSLGRADLSWLWESLAPEWALEMEGRLRWAPSGRSGRPGVLWQPRIWNRPSRRCLAMGTLGVLGAMSFRRGVRRGIASSRRRHAVGQLGS
jgi:hypothetical protein